LAHSFCIKGFFAAALAQSLPRSMKFRSTAVCFSQLVAPRLSRADFGWFLPCTQVALIDSCTQRSSARSTGSGKQARTPASGDHRIRSLLVLDDCCGLLLRSFCGLLHVPLGFNPQKSCCPYQAAYPNAPSTDIYRTAAQERHFRETTNKTPRGRRALELEEASPGDTRFYSARRKSAAI